LCRDAECAVRRCVTWKGRQAGEASRAREMEKKRWQIQPLHRNSKNCAECGRHVNDRKSSSPPPKRSNGYDGWGLDGRILTLGAGGRRPYSLLPLFEARHQFRV